MTRKLFEDNVNRALLDFTAMFDALSNEYRNSVVMRALRARDHVSTDAGRALDSAIRGSIRLVGYSNPALAISSALLEPVSSSVNKSEKLATATLMVWAESLDDLEKLVSGHLASEGFQAEYPDFENSRFRDFWDENLWQRQMDWAVEISDGWSEEDVALMLCYVSGKTIAFERDSDEEGYDDPFVEITSPRDRPAADQPAEASERQVVASPPAVEVARPAPAVPPASPPAAPLASRPAAAQSPRAASTIGGPAILNQCIEYLASLSPEDGNWSEAVPAFVEAMSNIRELKSAQRERRASLIAAHEEIIQEFSGDLEFLEQDTSFWSPQGLTELSELDRTLELADSLKRLLTEYREVRRPGTTLSEELGRRERRFALEPRILDSMTLIRQAMAGSRGGRETSATEGKASDDRSETSGLHRNNGREPPGPAGHYQGELIYEPMEEGRHYDLIEY